MSFIDWGAAEPSPGLRRHGESVAQYVKDSRVREILPDLERQSRLQEAIEEAILEIEDA